MKRKIDKAANDIETLAAYMKDLALELRTESDTQVAYAKVYYLRRDISSIVSSLGSGTPFRSRTNVRPLNLVNP